MIFVSIEDNQVSFTSIRIFYKHHNPPGLSRNNMIKGLGIGGRGVSYKCCFYMVTIIVLSLGSAWEVGAPITLQVGSSAPVSCMTAVHGRLWCGCQCNAIIYNTTTLKMEVTTIYRDNWSFLLSYRWSII